MSHKIRRRQMPERAPHELVQRALAELVSAGLLIPTGQFRMGDDPVCVLRRIATPEQIATAEAAGAGDGTEQALRRVVEAGKKARTRSLCASTKE